MEIMTECILQFGRIFVPVEDVAFIFCINDRLVNTLLDYQVRLQIAETPGRLLAIRYSKVRVLKYRGTFLLGYIAKNELDISLEELCIVHSPRSSFIGCLVENCYRQQFQLLYDIGIRHPDDNLAHSFYGLAGKSRCQV